MAINYSTEVKKARLQAVIKAIDAGRGQGCLRIGTKDMKVTLAVINLRSPAFDIKGSAMILNGVPLKDSNAMNAGKAASAEICDSENNVVISGITVGTDQYRDENENEADIVVTDDNVSEGDEVTITSGAIVHG